MISAENSQSNYAQAQAYQATGQVSAARAPGPMPVIQHCLESLHAHHASVGDTATRLRDLRDRLFGSRPEKVSDVGPQTASSGSTTDLLRNLHQGLANRLSEIEALVREIDSGL